MGRIDSRRDQIPKYVISIVYHKKYSNVPGGKRKRDESAIRFTKAKENSNLTLLLFEPKSLQSSASAVVNTSYKALIQMNK